LRSPPPAPARAARGADVARPDESREIARALRRYLEREADAGRGDLWAISARREATAPVATPATAPVATPAAAAPTAGVAEAELFDFSDPMSGMRGVAAPCDTLETVAEEI